MDDLLAMPWPTGQMKTGTIESIDATSGNITVTYTDGTATERQNWPWRVLKQAT